jgi:hypothetical protein
MGKNLKSGNSATWMSIGMSLEKVEGEGLQLQKELLKGAGQEDWQEKIGELAQMTDFHAQRPPP